jgi:capsular exopolysaccharide synthesis family protein
MNEVRQYLLLFRKWLWLLVAGALLGGAVGYIISLYQPTIYETTTKIMVSRSLDQEGQSYYFFNEIQLAKTYAQLINTGPILQALSDELGYTVNKGQVNVKQIAESLLLEITVQDNEPQRAAQIANSLVAVFIEYNDNLQSNRYQASEDSLKSQITEVEKQVNGLQSEMSQISEQTLETQRQQVSERIAQIEEQLNSSENQIIQIETELQGFFPAPLITNTPAPYWRQPTSTPAPLPTPTLSPVDEVKYKELQLRLDQISDLRNLYKDVYANLLVLDTKTENVDPAMRQQQLQTTLALYQQIYTNLLSSYENVRLARLRSTPNVVQIEAAPVPDKPIQPQPARNVMLGAFVGFVLMAMVAFTVEFMDDTIKTPEDVTNYLRVPVIGLIGEMGRRRSRDGAHGANVYVSDNPLSPITEAFRTLRTNLDFASVDKPIKTLLVTSTGPAEGKSTVAVNLAAVMAQGERKVVLVDTDLRRPSVHRFLGIANRKGLSDLFRDQTKLASVISTWGNPPFAVITSGGLPPNPTELLESEKMTRILAELKEKSDMVILDSPPTIVADPIAMSVKIDGVLLVIEPGKTKIGAAQVLMEHLNRAGARILGVVLNPISRKRMHYYSKYQYYTTYYYSRTYDRYFSKNGANKRKRGGNGANHRQKQSEEKTSAPME